MDTLLDYRKGSVSVACAFVFVSTALWVGWIDYRVGHQA